MVTVQELRQEAAKQQIKGRSMMNKVQLCNALADVGVKFEDCAKGVRQTKTRSPKKRSPKKRSPKKRSPVKRKRKNGGKGSPKRKSVPKKENQKKKTGQKKSPKIAHNKKAPKIAYNKKAIFKKDITILYKRMEPDYNLANPTKVALDNFCQEFIREIAPKLLGMDVEKVSFKGILPPEFEKYSRVEKLNRKDHTISFNKVDELIRNMGMKLHEEIVFFLRNVLEFILSDMLELGYNEARIKGKVIMTLTHLRTAVEEDTELRQMPGIQAIL